MNVDKIEKEIMSIISDISGFDIEEINLDTKLADQLEIDSIKAIEIVVAIEKKYKILIRDEDVPKIITVREAVDLVNTLVRQS
jgi:acyl carrier protein